MNAHLIENGYVVLGFLTDEELEFLGNDAWSSDAGVIRAGLYYVLEGIYDRIGKRYQVHSVKAIAGSTDVEAGDWHNDAAAWDDEGTCCTLLIYRTFNSNPLQVKFEGSEVIHSIYPAPGLCVLVDSTRPYVLHRAIQDESRSFVKVTFK